MSLWPQYTFIALVMMEIGLFLGKHGQPRIGTYSVWWQMLSAGIILFLLYKGGFFDRLPW
jgi:hypothetical protein